MAPAELAVIQEIARGHLILSLLLILLGAILGSGRVPMNGWFGVRLAVAYKSAWHWREMNVYGGRAIRNAGRALALTDVFLLFAILKQIHLPTGPVAEGVLLGLPLVYAGVAVYFIWRHGQKLAAIEASPDQGSSAKF